MAFAPLLARAAGGEKETLLDIQMGNGWHALCFDAESAKVNLGTAQKNWGCSLGGVVSHYFKSGAGFQSGLRFYLNRTNCLLDNAERYSTRDVVNNMDCVRTVRFEEWNERQTNLLVAVPVGFAYTVALSDKCGFYAGVGAEFLLPLLSRYKVEEGAVRVSGYYSDFDVEFSDMPVHNFATYSNLPNGDFSLKVGVAGYLDAGVRYHLPKCDLSAGLYFSYGFTNLADDNTDHLFDNKNEYNGLLNSQVVENAKPIAFGVKVGVTIPLLKAETK